MPDVYLHLGSNIGDKEKHINTAVDMIAEHIGDVVQRSSFYTTEPWGNENQEEYKNLAVHCVTRKTPNSVLDSIHEIETAMGRKRQNRWGPRKIDIDIIFYDDEIIVDSSLIIPHRLMHKRNFVLIPMLEIAAEFVHPILGLSVEDIYASSEDQKEVYLKESE